MFRKSVIEIVVFMTYAFFAMSWVAGNMMTKDIMSFYHVEGVTAATWMTNAITIAKIIGNLCAAWFLTKLGPKKAFAFASILIVAGIIGAFVSNYPMYVVTRLIMGFGGAFVIVYMNPVVMNYFSKGELPIVNGINAAAFNTGNLLAILFTGSLLAQLGTWQNVVIGISVVSFVLLVIWMIFSEDFELSSSKDGEAKKSYGLGDGVKDPVNWFLPFAYSGVLFCYISVFAIFPMVPNFAAEAKYLSSILIAAGMVGTVVGIIVAKRFTTRVPVLRWSGLFMTIFAAIMAFTSNAAIAYSCAFLAGFFMFVPMTSLVTLPYELPGMNPGRIAVVFAMFWSVSYIIETILMYISGRIADASGDIMISAIFAIVCSATLFVASFLLPEPSKQKAVADASAAPAE
ncbi:MFS transporter [uncultured Cohaesibacter sp.]|uniref:MFS transporter n=1 Tax=uncultured Cohaesibacter sp. TaxID=1002546 RepID=UPI0029C6D59D|nr:MFS transporter [uncultured Cohaesibacter sp.]